MASKILRILHGSSWSGLPKYCRPAYRRVLYSNTLVAGFYGNGCGFRTVRVLRDPPVKKGDKGSEN